MIFLNTFFLVLLWNIIPLFAPPTWMALSFISFTYHPHPLFLVAVVGAVAATVGRIILARAAFLLIRKKVLSEKVKKNIDEVKTRLEQNKKVTFGIFLFYAFGPFPSNQLFIAYGLTDLPISLVALPFFLGRMASYSFWVFLASEVSHKVAADRFRTNSYLGGYFIITQAFTIFVVWLFAKLDWKKLFTEKKIRLLR
jgi:membrane protein YqaA with SNARE-associated domain